MTGFVYIATPYTKYPDGITQAFVDACKVTAQFVRRGISAYSPIAHCHPVATHGGINPLDCALWLKFDQAIMDAASELYVIQMPGWDDSAGITHEIDHFRKAGKPVSFFSWPEHEDGRESFAGRKYNERSRAAARRADQESTAT